ncbi:MAG: hypothetical protein RLZZ316_1447 [Bacteroidota bacterium]
MKIALAQLKTQAGSIEKNIELHIACCKQAASLGAGLIVFPELSITNYEPVLAKEVAFTLTDSRLQPLQHMSNTHDLIIAAGLPLLTKTGVAIATFFFLPNKLPLVYYKTYLHADELPFFVPVANTTVMPLPDIAFAICYELSVPQHAAAVALQRPKLYIASVAKTSKGVLESKTKLAKLAKENNCPVLFVNAVGPADNFINAGGSFIMNKQGVLQIELSTDTNGILIFDNFTDTCSSHLLKV